jgi:hypothetical protein
MTRCIAVVSIEQAQVLARDGNAAVVQLSGRAFPGLLIQGDTFAELRRQLAAAASRLRRNGGDADALDDLDHAVDDLTGLLRFYEAALAERGIRHPYADG